MRQFSMIALFGFLLMTAASGAWANSNLSSQDDKADGIAIDNQVEEVEGYSYDDLSHQKELETKAVNKDIAKMQKQMAVLKHKRELAEHRHALALKKLQAVQASAKQTASSLKKSESQRLAAEKQLEQLQKKVQSVEERRQMVLEKKQKSQETLKQALTDQKALMKRKKAAEKQIEKASREKRALDHRRVQVATNVYKLKGQVARAETQAQRMNEINAKQTMVARRSQKDSSVPAASVAKAASNDKVL